MATQHTKSESLSIRKQQRNQSVSIIDIRCGKFIKFSPPFMIFTQLKIRTIHLRYTINSIDDEHSEQDVPLLSMHDLTSV